MKINGVGGGEANKDKSAATSSTASPAKKRSNLGVGFVAPDGGWGWLVVLAAGCSNVSQIHDIWRGFFFGAEIILKKCGFKKYL